MIKLNPRLYIFLFLIIFFSSTKIFGGTIPFVTTWKVDNEEDFYGIMGNNEVIINTSGAGYNYTVDWGDGSITSHTGSTKHSYSKEGIYTISITGVFPQPNFRNSSRLLSIEQWGNNKWNSMENAFYGCYNLQGNFIDAPDLSNVTNMESMFYEASAFNHSIANWDVSNVINMKNMFSRAYTFNQDIANWDVSNVTNMEGMFSFARLFNQDIGKWNVSNVINMKNMFSEAYTFNQNIGNWDVSNITDMEGVFSNARLFNQDIRNWDVSNVTNMEAMFLNAKSFNQNIGNWDVSKVTNMNRMFHLAVTFNQDIGNWDVSHVNDMSDMFSHAFSFNQDIGNWDVGNVIIMTGIFYIARSFNQDLSQWDVSRVRDMRLMFAGAVLFDQDLGQWNVSNVTNMASMFSSVVLSIENYDSLLKGWSKLNLQPNVPFSGGFSQYCEGTESRDWMITTFNWEINDGGSPAPLIDDIENQEGIDHYTLPPITGERLTGNEKYYTKPNGTGKIYSTGDVINFHDYPSYPLTLYIYDAFNALCTSEKHFELTIKNSTLDCSTLISPIPDSKNVLVNTSFSWSSVMGAEGYKISIGTGSNNNNILQTTDLGNTLSYSLPMELPEDALIFINITPYNSFTENISCQKESFTTEPVRSSGIPKYFTPNNDGYHDTWNVPDPLNAISVIYIYNRYGKLLKQITDTSEGWNGVYLNKFLPTNDYWYTIEYKNGDILKGHFSLIR